MSLILDGTSGLSDVDGTAAAPAIRGTDANTGIFFPAADTIAFAEGGAEAARFDSAGNFGIGTTTPDDITSGYTTVDVRGSTGGGLRLGVAAGNNMAIYASATTSVIEAAGSAALQLVVNSAERARIDSSGNLLVGSTSLYGGEKLAVLQSANNRGIVLQQTNASNASTALLIDCSRNTTNGTYNAIQYYNTGAGANKFYVIDSGAIYSTSTSITSTSDQRFKENIKDIDVGLTQVLALKPRRFDWIDGKGEDRKNAVGFIAQEVQEILPDLISQFKVTDADETKYLGLRTQDLIPTLVKAIQEQQALITALTTRITALEAA